MRSWPDHNITDNSRLKNVSFFLAVPLILFTFSFVQEQVAQDAKNQYKKKNFAQLATAPLWNLIGHQ